MNQLRFLFGTLTTVFALVASTANAQPALQASSQDDSVRISAELTMHGATSGVLTVRAEIADGFHIYAQSQPKPFPAARIKIEPSESFEVTGPFRPSVEPTRRRHKALDVELHEFEHEVSWTAPVRLIVEQASPLASGISEDALATRNSLTISGHVFAQACTVDRCLAPRMYRFEATATPPAAIPVPKSTIEDAANASEIGSIEARQVDSLVNQSATDGSATRFRLQDIEVENDSKDSTSLAVILPFALLAGFLLNFMPCVLPVVGLKVMSFVEQSGESRGRMFLLNLSYSAGLISVMLVLASLAVFAGLGWGEQFSSAGFNITLAVIVFAFALSFLGVWEIPIPGLVGTIASSGSAQSEGYIGAFLKGTLSTVLATPCSGPFLGSALTWAVTQSAYLTYLVFAAVGLGMASPYLLIGLFPKLIGFLPKPGNWMITFKQVMGFVLLATVVYLMTFMPIPFVVPTALLLLGIGIACWRLGTVVTVGTRTQKLRAWGEAALITSVVTLVSFGWLEGLMAERFGRAAQRMTGSLAASQHVPKNAEQTGIPWEPFSRDRLEELIREGKTVFVDFTADWCLTCKANEAVAIETAEVRELLKRNGIVALRADKTEPAPDVDETLRLLGNKAASIPFYAVFPAGRPQKPITLGGIFTSPKPILDALTSAGASHVKRTVVRADSGKTRRGLTRNEG